MARKSSRRRGATRAERGQRTSGGVTQLPWQRLRNPLPPIELLQAEQIEAIHDTSMQILEEVGMDFLHPEALELLRRGGADVEAGSERVRFDRGLIAETMAGAPSELTLHARNPAHHLAIGGNAITFGSVASPPNVSDLAGGRRVGNFADYCDLLRLAQSLNIIHFFSGYPVEPVDLPPATRHLDCLAAFVTMSDKAFHAYSLGRTRIRDALEIVRIGRGIDHETLKREPSLFTIVNTSSPLRLDAPMMERRENWNRMRKHFIDGSALSRRSSTMEASQALCSTSPDSYSNPTHACRPSPPSTDSPLPIPIRRGS